MYVYHMITNTKFDVVTNEIPLKLSWYNIADINIIESFSKWWDDLAIYKKS